MSPLSPSSRINLIRQIAIRLEGEPLSVIDLILGQFSVDHFEHQGGSVHDYLISTLALAESSSLMELGSHLGVMQPSAADTSDPPPFWIPGYLRLFISHLAEHRVEVGQLRDELRDYGITAFVAHNDIRPTTEWQGEIEKALATSDALVALLHPEFHVSNWTDQEIGYAMGRGLLIIAVRLGQDPYGFIGKFQGLNGMNLPPLELAYRIFKILQGHEKTMRSLSEGLVTQFERSNSYAAARKYADLLHSTQYWDESLTSRCVVAINENDQVGDSFGVPDSINKLLEKKRGGK